MKRILAVASGGGHWEQLLLLRPAFENAQVKFVTTIDGLAERSGLTATIVPDCNRNTPLRSIACAARLVVAIALFRPNVVISTGALPGLIALTLARKLGATTIWIDSVANAETMSMAGLQARSHADQWLTQWPDVAEATGAEYRGAVL